METGRVHLFNDQNWPVCAVDNPTSWVVEHEALPPFFPGHPDDYQVVVAASCLTQGLVNDQTMAHY
jgi:hypothetical protein